LNIGAPVSLNLCMCINFLANVLAITLQINSLIKLTR